MSFDVRSLFTHVTVSEALEANLQRLQEDTTLAGRTLLPPERIIHLLELSLRPTYFTFPRGVLLTARWSNNGITGITGGCQYLHGDVRGVSIDLSTEPT